MLVLQAAGLWLPARHRLDGRLRALAPPQPALFRAIVQGAYLALRADGSDAATQRADRAAALVVPSGSVKHDALQLLPKNDVAAIHGMANDLCSSSRIAAALLLWGDEVMLPMARCKLAAF